MPDALLSMESGVRDTRYRKNRPRLRGKAGGERDSGGSGGMNGRACFSSLLGCAVQS
jgi:hypothetical protein